MEERRERDPDTGEDTFVQTGAGISDMFWKLASKLTGKTAKKLATKVAEKGAEKIGGKNGQLIGEKKFMTSFPQKNHLKQKEKKLWKS